MPNIYITDETKELLERVVIADKRTQDGEINFLLSERAKQLNIPEVTATSVKAENITQTTKEGQGKS